MDTRQRGAAFDFPIPTQKGYQGGAAPEKPEPSGPHESQLKAKPHSPRPAKAGEHAFKVGTELPFPREKRSTPPELKAKKLATAKTDVSLTTDPTYDLTLIGELLDPADESLIQPVSAQPTIPAPLEPPSEGTSRAAESSGKGAAPPPAADQKPGLLTESDAIIQQQKKTIADLEETVQFLQTEISVNEDELLRRRQAIEGMSQMLLADQQSLIPLEHVKEATYQALRKGFALCLMYRVFESTTQLRFLLRTGFCALVYHAFGKEARTFFRERREREAASLSASPPPMHVGPPAAVEQTMKLLRTEQLFLMEENSKLLDEVHVLTEALQASPEKATELFQEFTESISLAHQEERVRKTVEQQSVNIRMGETSRVALPNVANLVISRFVTVIRLHHHSALRKVLSRWKRRAQVEFKYNEQKYQGCITYAVVSTIQCVVRRPLHSGFQKLRSAQRSLSTPRLSLIRRVAPVVYPMDTSSRLAGGPSFPRGGTCPWQDVEMGPGLGAAGKATRFSRPLLESTAFVLRPEYYSRLPSVTKWRQRQTNG